MRSASRQRAAVASGLAAERLGHLQEGVGVVVVEVLDRARGALADWVVGLHRNLSLLVGEGKVGSAPRVALNHQLLGDRHRDLLPLRRPQHAAAQGFVVDLQPGGKEADVLGRFVRQGGDRRLGGDPDSSEPSATEAEGMSRRLAID